MILLIDNYDSFVHNLARYVGMASRERRVVRNDAITMEEIERLTPEAIILSPGPMAPSQAGLSTGIVRKLGSRIPILGVCLGHQCIGEAYGGVTARAPAPVHGKTSRIHHDGSGLFAGLPSPFDAARYHSLIVDLPDTTNLDITARTDNHIPMAVRHKTHPVYGVQFHPESVLTPHGMALIRNFIDLADQWRAA